MATLNKIFKKIGCKKTSNLSQVVLLDMEYISKLELKMSLEASGYEILQDTNSPDHIYNLCSSLKPSACIFNMSVPSTDNLFSANLIQNQLNIPVILLTSTSSLEISKIIRNCEICAWLVKPIQYSDLVPVIDASIERYRSKTSSPTSDILISSNTEKRVIKRAAVVLSQKNNWDLEISMNYLENHAKMSDMSLNEYARNVLYGAQYKQTSKI